MLDERTLRAARSRLVLLALLLIPVSGRADASDDGAPVRIVVLKEHGVGSPALAQPYLDRFVVRAAAQNDWHDAKGQYFTSRAAAENFIRTEKPQYGILSLAGFLALRKIHGLEVVGRVAVKLVGGRRYDIISGNETDLAGCKGKSLASDHLDDPRFIDRVVAGGAFRLTDFKLMQTQRPLQTIKKVLDGEASCALIDDAQLADLSHLEGGDALHSVWESDELPPMAVVAFPVAPKEARARFQENLSKLCNDDGRGACSEVGIVSLEAAGSSEYAEVVAAYGE